MAFRSEILIKLDKKGRVLLPAAFRDELPADDRGAFVLYHSPNLPGGLFSVALSLGSPPPAVNRHRVSVEPGLSSPLAECSHPAV